MLKIVKKENYFFSFFIFYYYICRLKQNKNMDLNQFHFVKRFVNQVETKKDKDALRFFNGEKWEGISWKTLNEKVRNIARGLLSYSIEVGDTIGIFSNNMPQWTMIDIAAAIIRSSAVPIYATNTAEQAQYIINNAGIKILFVGGQEQYDKILKIRHLCPSLQKIVAIKKEIILTDLQHSLYLEDFFVEENTQYNAIIEQRISECNLLDIYTIIYTSGTTGDPKGVLIDYENLAYQLINHDHQLKVEEGKTSLAFLPLSHVFERAWTAYSLHKGVINYYLEDTNKIAETLKEVRPHYMCVVPRLLEKVYTKIYENITQSNLIKRLIFSFATRSGKQMLKAKQKNKKPSLLLKKSFEISDKLVFSKLRDAIGGNIEMIPCGGAALEPSIGRFFQVIGVNVKIGYGMTETTASVSCWDDIPSNLKSVGKLLPNLEVKIGENNEILVKGGSITKGYFNNFEETKKAFTEDGFLRTGDAGGFDKKGNLFITERIKELMKTSNGKYIAPQQIEGKVGKDSFIEQLAVIADARNFVSALIVPNFDALTIYAKDINLKYKNYGDLIKNHQIIDMFEKRLQRLQKELPNYEQIKKFTLLPSPFTIDKNELTPTLKLRRKIIYKNYKKEIEAMYA